MNNIVDLIRSIRQRDEAEPTVMEVILAYPGFHMMALFHPVAHWLWGKDLRALARLWSAIGRWVTGIEIHPAAKIGRNLFIDHGTGTVIGQTAIIGDDCRLYQGITLGGRGKVIDGRRHPHLMDGVTVGAGAHVLGPVILGHRAKVGAGSVVTMDVPSDMTAVGNPARLIGGIVSAVAPYGLPDGEMPDPVAKELHEIECQLDQVKRELEQIEHNDKTKH